MSQDDLFTKPKSIEDCFREFHHVNPHVYQKIVNMARALKRKGHKRCGIGMIFEVMRWHSMMRTVGDDFKLNNNYRSRYARLVEEREPDLVGFFEKRRLHS